MQKRDKVTQRASKKKPGKNEGTQWRNTDTHIDVISKHTQNATLCKQNGKQRTL